MRVLSYPCFLSCSEWADDEYWKNVFEDLAFGITPSGVYISKDYIISHGKSREFVYKINPDTEPAILYTDIYGLFSEKLGLKSAQDTETYRASVIEDANEMVFDSWNSIKKKSVKDAVILNYVTRMSIEHGLSTRKTRELLNAVNLSILLKFITSKQIHYEHGEIVSIEGFTFCDDGTFTFGPATTTTGGGGDTDDAIPASSPTLESLVSDVDCIFECNKERICMADAWVKLIATLRRATMTTCSGP